MPLGKYGFPCGLFSFLSFQNPLQISVNRFRLIPRNSSFLIFGADLVPTRCRYEMPVLKLTKKNVDGLEPGERTYLARDAELKGFAVRVGPTGAKSWVVCYRPPPGGRGVREKVVTLGQTSTLTPDQARRAAADMLARVRLGADPAEDKTKSRKALTVAEMIDRFDSDHVAIMVKPKTAVTHRYALAELKQAHGNLKAEKLTRSHLAALHSQSASRPYSANRALAVWAKLYSWGASSGYVPEGKNPTRGIAKYKESSRERFLSTAELSRIGEALTEAEGDGLPWRAADPSGPKARHLARPENRIIRFDPAAIAALRLLILTGCRLREILHLQWHEVDIERGLLFLGDSKTGAKTVVLNAPAMAILNALPNRGPYVIPGGKPGAPRADLKRLWDAVTARAELQGVRIHDLRHTFASFGAGGGLGLPIVGKLLGHTQTATTARYAHLDADPLRRAADKIGAEISAALDGRKPETVTPIRKVGQ